MKNYFLISLLFMVFLFPSCKENIKQVYFPVFLDEPCMIVNREQNNLLEGDYLRVKSSDSEEQIITIDLPDDFIVNTDNFQHWIVGWGSGIPLYDAGPENLRPIISIDHETHKISLGSLLRGSGFPAEDQRVVFWNTRPSGFYNYLKEPVIDRRLWPQFDGDQVSFGGIEYDSILDSWVMIIYEVGTGGVQIYAALSDNLTQWSPALNGAPILKPEDFREIPWGNGHLSESPPRTPFVSDIIRYNDAWYMFLHGFSEDGLRHIGLAVSDESLLGPYKIHKEPLISPGPRGSWDDVSAFYPVVEPYKDGFIMFYDGRNSKGLERVGMATSKDLLNWEKSPANPVIDQHVGWRSKPGVSEPCYLEIRNDSIFLLLAGAKEFKMGPWHHHVTRRMYMDVSGNVDDAQLGFYLSVDGGKTFKAHVHNPVFINDYSNPHENEHMGGNFRYLKTDTAELIFYQAKSSFERERYNVLLRERKLRPTEGDEGNPVAEPGY